MKHKLFLIGIKSIFLIGIMVFANVESSQKTVQFQQISPDEMKNIFGGCVSGCKKHTDCYTINNCAGVSDEETCLSNVYIFGYNINYWTCMGIPKVFCDLDPDSIERCRGYAYCRWDPEVGCYTPMIGEWCLVGFTKCTDG